MNQDKIKLLRVDNRLVHGQVAVSWTATLSITKIIVVDDEVAFSSISQKLMQSMAKSVNVKISFYTAEEFIKICQNEQFKDTVFVVVKTIQMSRRLVEGGIRGLKINIGNIHYQKGRIAFNKKMYVTKQDVEDIQYMTSCDCDVFYQDVPGTSVEKLNQISNEQLNWRDKE